MSTDTPIVTQLTAADLTDIVELQRAVTMGLPVGFIRLKSEAELRAYLDGTLGVAYGINEGAALVAMCCFASRIRTIPITVCGSLSRCPELSLQRV